VPQLPTSTTEPRRKGCPVHALWAQVQALLTRVATLEAKSSGTGENPGQFQVCRPRKGQKPNKPESPSVSGRALQSGPQGRWPPAGLRSRRNSNRQNRRVRALPGCVDGCDQVLHGRYDKIDLPVVRPLVTRVERYRALHMLRRRHPGGDPPRAWKTARRSASISWPWHSTSASPMRSVPPFDAVVFRTSMRCDQRGGTGCDVAARQAALRQ